VDANYAKYLGKLPRNLFDALNQTSATPDKLAESVEAILVWLKGNDPYD
jgi:hypothetical protein